MNPDAIVLALLAIGDLALLAYLRQRHARRIRLERMTASLRLAVKRANSLEEMPAPPSFQKAS